MPNEITNIKIDMAKLQKDISYTKEKVDNIDDKLTNFIKHANSCYASKDRVDKLEKFVSKVMWTAVISLIGFLFSFFKNYLFKILS